MALHILLLDQQWQFYPIEEIYRWDKRRCLSLSLSTVMLAQFSVVKSWDCPCCMSHSFLQQQWKLLSWSITLHKIKPHGPLWVVTDSFLFHFKPWVTEVKYSDPSLHLASKGGIQPLHTVGTAASKGMASIHTGKCLQHLLLAGGRQDFPRGSLWAQAQSTTPSRTVALAEVCRSCMGRALL